MKKVIVDESKCIRCGSCMRVAADVFGYGNDGESVPLVDAVTDDNKDAVMAMECCPTGAIILEETSGDVAEGCDCENCECDDCDCDDCDCEDCECENCDCNHEE